MVLKVASLSEGESYPAMRRIIWKMLYIHWQQNINHKKHKLKSRTSVFSLWKTKRCQCETLILRSDSSNTLQMKLWDTSLKKTKNKSSTSGPDMKLHQSLFPWRSFSHLTQNAPTLLSLFSFKHVWCVPVLTTVLQLHAAAAAITSCRAASLYRCCARGVGGHLGRHAEPWVQLSKTQSTLPQFDQNKDGRGRGKRSPCTSAPNRQSARCQHFNCLFTPISPSQLKTSPLFWLKRRHSWSVTRSGQEGGAC